MRLLAVFHKYPPLHNAGAEWMAHTIFRTLVERGHEVTVLLYDQDLAPFELDGVLVICQRRGSLDHLARWSDVLVTHLDRTQEAVTAARGAGRPLVHIVHNLRQLAFHTVRPDAATLVVANSEWLARELGWPGLQVICRPPVTVADYELERDPYREPFVTLVNVTLEKGATRFFDLARTFPDRRFLAVCGAYGIQAIRRVPGNVRVLEHTAAIRDDVYARTRVLLMPSETETWGRVAIEAAASGIPTIAHPTEGLVEALDYAGLFHDRADGSAWEDELRRLGDRGYYDARSALARRRAVELERVTDADLDTLEAAILDLVRTNPTPRPYDAAMPRILDSARAGLRCPICGAGGCSCTPTADDVYSRLQADTPHVDSFDSADSDDKGPQAIYRTALGDFVLAEDDAKREGYLAAGDTIARPVLTRFAKVIPPEELEAIVDAYRSSYPEARQTFLSELALVDRHRTADNVDRLRSLLAPASPESPPAARLAEPEAEASHAPHEAPVEGRVGDVLVWVGNDAGRARDPALDAERAGKNRPTLVAKLEELAG